MLLEKERRRIFNMSAADRAMNSHRRRNLYTNYAITISKENYQQLHSMDDVHYKDFCWPISTLIKRAQRTSAGRAPWT